MISNQLDNESTDLRTVILWSWIVGGVCFLTQIGIYDLFQIKFINSVTLVAITALPFVALYMYIDRVNSKPFNWVIIKSALSSFAFTTIIAIVRLFPGFISVSERAELPSNLFVFIISWLYPVVFAIGLIKWLNSFTFKKIMKE